MQANASYRGITVSGSATKKVAATSAQLTLNFYSLQQPKPNATPGPALDETRLAPIIDAMVQAGVSRSDISFPLGSRSDRNATLVATVPNPTASQMQRGISIVGSALDRMPELSLNAQVQLQASNCGEVTDAVRGMAIANAREKAESVAKQLGVHLGAVVNVVANDQVPPNGICQWQYGLGQGNPTQLGSPEDWVSVPVYSSVSITYAIKN